MTPKTMKSVVRQTNRARIERAFDFSGSFHLVRELQHSFIKLLCPLELPLSFLEFVLARDALETQTQVSTRRTDRQGAGGDTETRRCLLG